MRAWIAASAGFFVYVAMVAPLVRGLPARRRVLAAAGSAVGVLISAAAHIQPHSAVLHDWILPPVLLLLAYWTSGLLFAAPMPRVETVLERIDRALSVDRVAAAAPRAMAELLELAYAGVYPLIPLALGVHLLVTESPEPERFWTVILITDYVCFGFLPWIQTRPPRAFRPADPWTSRVRRFNLRMLGKTSIQVNTFPSGHAAEALAAALLVVGAPWPWVACLAIGAVLVSAGAVLGRYHYAADAIAGWAVVVCVWMLV
jgi:PAP2 superfamily